jgi:acylphosphatase
VITNEDIAMSSNQQLHAIVYGRVQGVSFRFYTVAQANTLGLTGWVRNLPDDTVEVVAEGGRPQLESLLTWLHQGSPGARVTSVDAEWRPATGAFREFVIVRYSE